MTLYYTLVFMLLVTEMVLFLLLILPLPFPIRRKMFTFISESKLVAKVQYGMKITFIFILILFIDSVNRVYRVQIELASATEKHQNGAIMGHERTEVQARKFYSQRNMYLCGFTLFLSLILNRTYTMILDLLRLEEKIKAYETGKPNEITKAVHAATSPGEIGGLKGEIAELRREVERKDKQVQAMKSQAEGLHRSYDDLAEKYAQATGEDGNGKKDN